MLVKFVKNRYSTNIFREDSSIVKLKLNCECFKEVNIEKNVHTISIKLSDSVLELIKDIEHQGQIHCTNNNKFDQYVNSLNNDILQVKIPYRYKKYEATFYNNDNDLITIFDIKEGNNIEIELECKSLWTINNFCGITWKTNKIKVI